MNEPVIAFLRYFVAVCMVIATSAYIGYVSNFSDVWLSITAISFIVVFVLALGVASACASNREGISAERIFGNLFSYLSGASLVVMGFCFLSWGEAFVLLGAMILVVLIVPCAHPINDPRLKKEKTIYLSDDSYL